MNRIRKFAKIFLGLPLTLITFIFVGKLLFDSWPKIQESLATANPILVLVGIFFLLGFFLMRSILWIKILNFYGESDKGFFESIYHYSLAETRRYIPGNIFSFVSRVHKFGGKNHPKKIVIRALILEAVVMSFSALIVSLPAIYKLIGSNLLIGLALTALFVVIISLFLKFFKNIDFVFSIFPKRNIFSYIDIISIFILAWALFGLGNYFLASSIFPNNPNQIILFSSIFTFSWLIGYLSFVAPMGLGVREAATVFLLAPFVPVYASATIALFTRIFLVLSEVVFLTIVYFIYKRIKSAGRLIRGFPSILVILLGVIYAVYFSYFTITRHLNFYSGKFDLGNMENTLWNTINGNLFIYSNPDGTNEISRLSAHADFVLLFFAPIYALYQSVNILLVIQSVILGLGGIFVYLISRKVIKSEKISVLLAIGFYLNYFVQEQNIFDFHSVSMATTFLLAAFYFLITKRYKLLILMLTLAVSTKENVYLVSSIFGSYLFLNGKRFLGGSILFISLAVFVFLMAVAIPNSRGGQHFALSYFSYLGDSSFQILFSPILEPVAFFSQIFSKETLIYIYTTFLPTGFLSLLSPLYIIFLLPDFLINIFSNNPNLRSIQYHYGALIIPFVYISTIYGIRKIISSKKLGIKYKNIIFYYLLAFILYSTWRFSPVPGTRNADIAAFVPVENRIEISKAINLIPQQKSVSATNNIAAHLVKREKIYVIPNAINIVDYLVFYKDKLELAQELALSGEEFIFVYESKDLIILKRLNPYDKDYRL